MIFRREHGCVRIFGFRVIRDETAFRKLVAHECYGLTHELVTNKLQESFTSGLFSGYTDSAWLELDRQMKAFTSSV